MVLPIFLSAVYTDFKPVRIGVFSINTGDIRLESIGLELPKDLANLDFLPPKLIEHFLEMSDYLENSGDKTGVPKVQHFLEESVINCYDGINPPALCLLDRQIFSVQDWPLVEWSGRAIWVRTSNPSFAERQKQTVRIRELSDAHA